MTHLVVAKGDDWIGIYVDGTLRTEGHQIDLMEGMRLAMEFGGDMSLEDRWVNLNWLNDFGSLPTKIADVIWEGAPYKPEPFVDEDEA